jgi:tRNA dimethylallyltransferase
MAILVIGGPTAVGKSRLSLDVAEAMGAVIVSADAMTIYRDLDVGTAKPSVTERRGILHYCVDVRAYNEVYSVGDFVEDTHAVIQEHEHVIIAGGTPYYLNALFRPLAPLPESQPLIRAELEQLVDPHQRLLEVDPIAAQRLHPNDRYRIVRALEVYEITGRPLTDVQQDPPMYPPLDAEIVWLERDDLRPRIGQRIEQMMSQGYLEECQRILDEDWDLSAKPLQSFSYKYLLQHLQGEMSLEDAIERTEIGTWHLARKQRTWSRNIGWRGISLEEAEIQIEQWISRVSG